MEFLWTDRKTSDDVFFFKIAVDSADNLLYNERVDSGFDQSSD